MVKTKKTNNILLIIIVIFITKVLAAGNGTNINLIKNGDFEKSARRIIWWSLEKISPEGTMTILKNVEDAQSGAKSVKLILKKSLGGEVPEASLLSPAIDVEYGLYILKGWYKTSGKSKASIKYTTIDFTGIQTRTFTKELKSVDKWTEFVIPVNIRYHYKIKTGYLKRYKVDRISIALLGRGDGAVFFDDIGFSKSDDPIQLRLYPAEYREDNLMPFVKDGPNYLRIMLCGDKERLKSPVKIQLDMPEGTDDYGVFGGGSPVVVNGQKCVRFQIDIPKSEIEHIQKETKHASVTCWFNISKIKRGQKIFYRAVMGGNAYTQKDASVKILPALPEGPRPKKFRRLVSWATFGDTHKGTVSSNYMPESIFPDVYNLVRSIGLNDYLIFNSEEPRGWKKYIYNHMREDGAKIWANVPPGFFEKFYSGEGWETKAINGGVGYIKEICGDYYEKMKPLANALHIDFEPPNAEKNPLWEYIPARKMFAEKYGYDFSGLTTERLKNELRKEWLDFRSWQIGEALRIWAEYVHSINPDWELTVSQGDGYPMDKYLDYGVYNDISHIVHMPQIYLETPIGLARNVIALKKHFPNDKFYPVITAYMVADKGWPAMVSAKTMYSDNITIAMLGCIGSAQWPDLRRGMDMEYLWEISRAMRDISYLEDYVIDGSLEKGVTFTVTNDDVDWENNSLARAYNLRGTIMIAFNNMHKSQKAEVKVVLNNISGSGWYVYDPVSSKKFLPKKGERWSAAELKNGLIYEASPAALKMLVISKNSMQE